MTSPAESDYGSELDYTDEALAAQLDQAESIAQLFIKQPERIVNAASGSSQTRAQDQQESGATTESTSERFRTVLEELEGVQVIGEDKRSLWSVATFRPFVSRQQGTERHRCVRERYRKRRGWGALSVSDFASPMWCEVQHTYRLASKSWLPALSRPPTITTSNGVEIPIDQAKTVRRDKILDGGTTVHSRIQKQVMGDVQQVRVETEGGESWWALRILNTIVALSVLIEQGRVRELPVVGFVGDHVVFGVIDEVERREIQVPPRPRPQVSTASETGSSSSTRSYSSGKVQPATPKKSKRSKPVTQTSNNQLTLLTYFSPSPTKVSTTDPATVAADKLKRKDPVPGSDDALFRDLTSEDDLADLAALAEVEELERLRHEFEHESPRTRWGYVLSDTKTRFNRSIPPVPETQPSRLQLMLYHRLLTSLLLPQPEPPPPRSSPSLPAASLGPYPLVPTGPFDWRRLYAKFGLEPDRVLGRAFLDSVRPIIAGSELEDLLGAPETLGAYVEALSKIAMMLTGEKGREDNEVLESQLEITYVLRQDDDEDHGNGQRKRKKNWKGRRSATKQKEQERREEVALTPDRDEEADLDKAIRLSLEDQATARTRKEEDVVSLVANPSLPLPSPLAVPLNLPPPLSQQTVSNDDDHDDVSLPLNSQASAVSALPEPARPFGDGATRARYNLRSGAEGTKIDASRAPSPNRVAKSSQASSPSSSVSGPPSSVPPNVIGTTRFPLSFPLLSSHLARSLSYWNGEREAVGVSIEHVNRCRTCEFEDGCEWRQAKAKEAAEARNGREKRRREVEVEDAAGGDRDGVASAQPEPGTEASRAR
ncbi:hypothetical protein JCM11491_001756 [Sporobolomyces phaffii]